MKNGSTPLWLESHAPQRVLSNDENQEVEIALARDNIFARETEVCDNISAAILEVHPMKINFISLHFRKFSQKFISRNASVKILIHHSWQ